MAKAEIRFYAVPDPDDPGLMTYWRERNGILYMWPNKARYGPTLLRSDVPKGLVGYRKNEWAVKWYHANRIPWQEKVNAAIEADRDKASAVFAAFCTRCGFCGKELKEEKSKVTGIGPECVKGLPDELVWRFIQEVSAAHARHLESENASHE
jgi:hypothetical protein